MMYPIGTGMSSGGWILMSVGSVLFLVLLVFGVVAAVRALDRPGPAEPSRGGAEQMLADRFAHGDIDAEEYEQRLRTLRANRV